eukprot:CAMPEP_0178448608 /NCGR_PEP_ID=MMETSP0689_2-20121128/42082_1 /TAXON_ID=160604 /ORGANISM="Amphidinium massartii, Strain CS-259" /LENGTH=185 /DNA_ID=CAMNT_0020073819 /DNA_START=10 /DNA_END=564 /DNA_ORIENTATION=+
MRAVALLSAGLCILNAFSLSSSPLRCFSTASATLSGRVSKPTSRISVHASVNPADCAGVREEAVDGVILPAMDDKEPEWLGYVLARYLDEEWMIQDAHDELGNAVAKMYRESREAGDDEVTAVLAKLSLGLKDQFKQGIWGDLFEGPVDIANRAIEFLMLRSGRQVWSYGRSNEEVQAKLLKRLS